MNFGITVFRSENREIEDITVDELNVLICRFMMDIKKTDGGAHEATTFASFAFCFLSREKKKKKVIHRPTRSLVPVPREQFLLKRTSRPVNR